MNDEERLRDLSRAIAAAIGRRDVDSLARLLAPGFVHHGHDGSAADAAAFLQAVRTIPGEIVFVRLERTAVAVAGGAAMVTGVQHAQVKIDGAAVDDRRSFADFFVKIDGSWKLRAAADFPA